MTPIPDFDLYGCTLDGVHLLEASAGTGKTWNLSGLYLRLLLERRLRVEQILVVTFTRAATAELRERIRERLAELVRTLEQKATGGGDPLVPRLVQTLVDSGRIDREDARRRVRLALECFEDAAICTIHGFCQRALGEAPFAAGAPFAFQVEGDDLDLRLELAADYWRRQVAAADWSPLYAGWLADQGIGPGELAAQWGRIAGKPLTRLLWPEAADDPLADEAALEAAYRRAAEDWAARRAAIVGGILGALDRLNGQSYRPHTVEAAAAAWDAWLGADDPVASVSDGQKLFTAGFLEARTRKGKSTPVDPFHSLAEDLLARHKAVLGHFRLRRLHLLRGFLEHARLEAPRRKLAGRRWSFDDLLLGLHRALEAGANPALADALRARFPVALIDEFQDTDPVQYAIFRRIYGDRGPLFLVGDPKQAIYAFRNADLHTYLSARRGAEPCSLGQNQRSTAPLIAACNALFGRNPRAFLLEGLDYHPVTLGARPRKPFADDTEPRGALHVWELPSGEDGKPPAKTLAKRLSARACAAEIARLLDAARTGRIHIDGQPLRAGQIAVVVRKHAEGALIRHTLAEVGVGSVESGRESVWAAPAAEEMERVLLAVAEPGNPGRLRAALATELVGLDGGAIATLEEDADALAEWVVRCQHWRGLWLERGYAAMWRTLLRETGAQSRLLVVAGGERRLTDLRHLGELLQQDSAAGLGIEALLRRFSERRRAPDGNDEAAQRRLESDENLVQILTIHQSKGLEYPIVFCPFLWDGAPGGGRQPEGMGYHDAAGGAVLDFAQADPEIARQAVEREQYAEQLRLAYVALTRAVYRCYLVAGAYRAHNGGREWARSPLNWLVAGAGVDFAGWRKGETDPACIAAGWEALEREAGGAIRRGPWPLPAQGPSALAGTQTLRREARPYPGPPPHESWRIGSFSSLVRGLEFATETVADHDALAEAGGAAAQDAELPSDDILRFPRGAEAGTCIHRLLELVDFSAPQGWDAAIAQALAETAPTAVDGAAPAMLRRMLEDLCATQLCDGFRLAELGLRQRLSELPFALPAAIGAGALRRLLDAGGYPPVAMDSVELRGYLRGCIDLVFRHAGRWYLIDWKSNHLGTQPANYGPAALEEAMGRHGYHLQALCYALALHRHLGRRLPGYRYERDFGGCLYLFVRGVRPGWIGPAGRPAGVHFHRPAEPTIAALDRLCGPGSAPATHRPEHVA